jgi:hypothetical protein
MRGETLGDVTRQAPHWSPLGYRLKKLAGPGVELTDWLIDQANLRGFNGAFNARPVTSALAPSLSLEELVAGLLRPGAVADARVFKLVVRMLQSGQVSVERLCLEARRERVEHILHWLLEPVPLSEHNAALDAFRAAFASTPRGYRGVSYRYDPQRLVRQAATGAQLWRAKQR